jgi:glycerophosphoryl diester phosphodiesterase
MSGSPARPLILGHRGAPGELPENTLAGFSRALELGADGVELDVQRSSDRVPVVIHDESLERTGHGRGRVADRSWADLSPLRGRGEPIPSLAQAAGWAARTGAWLNVEIKATDVTKETVAVLRAAGLGERVILSSFHRDVVEAAARLAPDVRRYLLLDAWSDTSLAAVLACGAQGVCLEQDSVDDSTMHALREARLPVVVWTVDGPARIARMVAFGVAAIITNRPAVAVRIRG